MNFDYELRANTNYDTGLYQVYDGPVSTNQVTIKQSGGNYCDLRISRVQYTTVQNGQLHDANGIGGATYTIPDGLVFALEVDFYQNYWDGVDCSLSAYTAGGSGVTGDEQLRSA